MKTMDRRNWLRTAGLSGGFLFLGGMEALSQGISIRPLAQDGMIWLNANENPYSPSESVKTALTDSFDLTCRYPFRVLSDLVTEIAGKEGVSKDHIVVTGGSAEGLRVAGLFCSEENGEIVAADPTFQVLLSYAAQFGAKVNRVPVDENLDHDLKAMSKKVNKQTRLIFICNPNNPTGTVLDRNALRDFCLSHDGQSVVFIDEAYYDFITKPEYPSMVDLVKEERNVIVSKTFSKVYGLAGLRIGYLIARPDLARKLKRGVMAMTNVLAIAAARAALLDDDFYKFSIAKNMEAKGQIYRTLDELGLRYVESHANFVFFQTGRDIYGVIESMKNEGIQIGRPFPPLTDWARVSTGTREEMDRLGNALRTVFS